MLINDYLENLGCFNKKGIESYQVFDQVNMHNHFILLVKYDREEASKRLRWLVCRSERSF